MKTEVTGGKPAFAHLAYANYALSAFAQMNGALFSVVFLQPHEVEAFSVDDEMTGVDR